MPVLTRAAERENTELSRRSAAKGAALVLVLLVSIFAIWVALTLAAPVGGGRFYWAGGPVAPQGISGAFRGGPTGNGAHRQTVRLGKLAFEFAWTDRH